ncbi:hypothetical protein [Pseudonocardia endophytica]|uniref:Uncharacterized protein n=1 Tax=Pseudonocardia endophytica TaxID=401976 RepID=A0A4R1HP06_PSEEN|nr:hypothetical protein [Pseudonocardia endophytica]TCK22863.1 hypothetical protein EV378_6874 [Pseudonocardia endophytica]
MTGPAPRTDRAEPAELATAAPTTVPLPAAGAPEWWQSTAGNRATALWASTMMLPPRSAGRAPEPAAPAPVAERDADPGVLDTIGGALQGEFREDPTVPMILIDTAVSLIPGVDQVADVRDVAAHLHYMINNGEYRKPMRWVGLSFSLVGAVPEVGTVVKGISKLAIRQGRRRAGELVELARRVLPGGDDLGRLLAWWSAHWSSWVAYGQVLWAKVLGQVRTTLERIPQLAGRWKTRLLGELAEIERRSVDALNGAFSDLYAKADEMVRQFLGVFGVDAEKVAEGLGMRPALATSGAGGTAAVRRADPAAPRTTMMMSGPTGKSGTNAADPKAYSTGIHGDPAPGLHRHEPFHNKYLEVKKLIVGRLKDAVSRENPVIRLPDKVHTMVTRFQHYLGLFDEKALATMSVDEVLSLNRHAMESAAAMLQIPEFSRKVIDEVMLLSEKYARKLFPE